MSNPIQVLKPAYRKEEILKEIAECLDRGWTGLGFKTTEFEEKWKEFTGLPYAHMVNSGTAGLHLALAIFKQFYEWSEGDEIITTPLTFVSTNHAILYERLDPVFADIDSETLCLSPDSVLDKITDRTRAVIYVGVGGRVGHLQEISKICKQRGIKLILDAAHMAGTRLWKNHIGLESDVSVFSFQSVKNLPTADAGMICFRDAELDARARKMSWLGIDKDTYARSGSQGTYKWRYDVPYLGFKYHGNSIMAAMGLVQLRYLEEDNRRRREIASLYDNFFDENKTNLDKTNDCIGSQSSQHLYQVLVDNRDSVLQQLNTVNIFPGVHYIDNTSYSMYRDQMNPDSTSWRLQNKLLSLPIHLEMTNEDVSRVAKAVHRIVGKKE